MINEILRLKKEKNVVILAHYYQTADIQDIADFVDDSLGLSEKASNTNADIILFAGVKFMAETAKILNPSKKVLLPDMNAGCSLADSCRPSDFKKLIDEHPGCVVVSYINCSAEVKTLSDIICTSGNAVDIVNSIPESKQIIFAPDKNLGNYINNITGRNMILWDGSCKVHDTLNLQAIVDLKIAHPDAKLIAHPECRQIILEMADFIGSTAKLIQFTQTDISKKFIVATETGVLHQMKKSSPEKEFMVVPADKNCACNDCEFMKMITIEKIYNSLLTEQPEILLDAAVMEKAREPIMKMLKLSAERKK
jgi:quinolinate synthase